MPRRGNVPKREILPDPIYNSVLVTKLVNSIMLDGKKGVAQKIVYGAFEIVEQKTGKSGLEAFITAMENIMLAAHSLGIGSVWINQVRDVCDTPEVRSILKEWEIPDSHVIFGIAALGYAKGPVNQNPEKTGAIHFVD